MSRVHLVRILVISRELFEWVVSGNVKPKRAIRVHPVFQVADPFHPLSPSFRELQGISDLLNRRD